MMKFSFAILALSAAALSANAAETVHYKAAPTITIGGEGGWDALTVDEGSRHLFLSHSDRVVVVDVDQNKVLKEITGTKGVYAIAVAAALGKAYSSNGKANEVSVIDLKKLEITKSIKVGANPDAIVYDTTQKKVFAFNGKGNSISVIDATTDKVVATIAVTGKLEFAVVDEPAHRLFVNIEDKNSVVQVDTATDKVLSTWPVKGCESPSGIALDAKNARLFVVCENKVMVMLDASSGKVLSSVVSGEGTDGLVFDSALGLAISSNGGDATMTVARESGPNELKLVENIPTEKGARTIALDAKTHRVFLPTASFAPGAKGEHPKPLKDTQKLLSFAP